MKKIKFAVQVFILIAAFPVLFLTGITDRTIRPVQVKKTLKGSVSGKKNLLEDKCLCRSAFLEYKGIIHQINVNN